MGFRDKARTLVGKRPRGDTLSKTDSNNSSRERWPSNVYKPGEPMPRPKYRAPPEKKHKEKLEAFSFADSWLTRRKSQVSTYSPMGTRAPSRRNSFISLARRKSYGAKSQRTNSVGSSIGPGDTRKDTPHSRNNNALDRLNTLTDVEGDDDVTNVGMSRIHSHEGHPPTTTNNNGSLAGGAVKDFAATNGNGYLKPSDAKSRPRTAEIVNGQLVNGIPPVEISPAADNVQAHDHQPFTEQDFALALSKTKISDREREREV